MKELIKQTVKEVVKKETIVEENKDALNEVSIEILKGNYSVVGYDRTFEHGMFLSESTDSIELIVAGGYRVKIENTRIS